VRWLRRVKQKVGISVMEVVQVVLIGGGNGKTREDNVLVCAGLFRSRSSWAAAHRFKLHEELCQHCCQIANIDPEYYVHDSEALVRRPTYVIQC